MNQVIETICSRRSIRGYKNQIPDREIVDKIIHCGRCAPNAWGHQSFEIVAVTNRELINKIADVTAGHLGGEREDHNFFSAPLIILITDFKENYMRLADAGCVMENMFIAAASLGLGSVWVNQLYTISDQSDVIQLLEEMGIENDRMVSCIGAFGYPDAEPTEKELISRVRYID